MNQKDSFQSIDSESYRKLRCQYLENQNANTNTWLVNSRKNLSAGNYVSSWKVGQCETSTYLYKKIINI